MVEGRTEDLLPLSLVEDIPGVPPDVAYIGNRLERMAALIEEIRDTSIRRERPNPMLWEIIGTDGGTSSPRVQTSLRIRVRDLIIMSGSTSTTVTLNVGQRTYGFACSNSVRTAPVPFPIVIDKGVDLFASAAAAVSGRWGFYVFGWPDE